MLAILKRELKNYLKHPLFWLGTLLVILGVYQSTGLYLGIQYLDPGDSAAEVSDAYPDTVPQGEVYEGYIPVSEEERRGIWEAEVRQVLTDEFFMRGQEAEVVIQEMKDMSVPEACNYLREEYDYHGAIYAYEYAAYRKGTNEEINAYIAEKMEVHPFSYYFARKFADFAGLYMGFFASIFLFLLFWQDTRKNTWELLHTKPVSAAGYVAGKVGGGFAVCLLVLVSLILIFWGLAALAGGKSAFEVRLFDFVFAACLYILPNMLMITAVHTLVSLIFRTPIPAVPFLLLYIIYSNMGSRNAEGVFGYYGRPLAIMVRFPGEFFDTAPPPMVLFNQCFLILAAAGIVLISIRLWKRRRI